jgi:hypothetical protein
MRELKDNGRRALQFDNLRDVTAWLAATPRTPGADNSAERYGGGARWDLNAGYAGALRMASEGWEDGVKNLHALATTVPNLTVTTRTFSVAGDFPDVARAVVGNPFNMIRRGKEHRPKGAMTLVIGIGGTADVDAKEMANYGAAMVALVDRLESRGVRVELLAHWGNRCSARSFSKWGMTWHVKHAEDALDLSAVAFSLAHPAMMRRLGFAAMERSDQYIPGYGGTLDYVDKDLLVDVPEGALLIPGVQGGRGSCRTMEGALAFAKAAINKAAGEDIAELEDLDA